MADENEIVESLEVNFNNTKDNFNHESYLVGFELWLPLLLRFPLVSLLTKLYIGRKLII